MKICNFFKLLSWFVFFISGCGGEGMESAAPLSMDLSSDQQAWETGVSPDAPNGSHQWLFARGLEILRRHAELPGVSAKLAWLDTPECLGQVRQGLFDADYLSVHSGARWDLTPEASTLDYLRAGATYAAHFYDPDTGKNYAGQASPTAAEKVRKLLGSNQQASAQGLHALACHELGVAAHFLGDLAQPMHAALFTSKDFPLYLHSNLEGYAMDIQTRYVIQDWEEVPQGTVDDLILETASISKALWPDTLSAIRAAYGSRGCWFRWRLRDNPDCWQGDAALDGWIGASIQDAQVAQARFLYLMDFAPTQLREQAH